MPQRANSLVPIFFAGSFAATAMLVANGAGSAAEECLEKPNLQINQPGHWYYRSDRILHRRCWFFQSSETTDSPPASDDPAASAGADSQPSWFSQFAAAWGKTLAAPPQQNNALEDSSPPTRTTSPRAKTNKIVRKERSQPAPLSETNGAASAERQNQWPAQSASENNEQHPSQLSTADREALFDEFRKWYVDHHIFGRP